MAKRARTNLAQKRKDNRTSNLPLMCSHSKCDCDFYISRNNPAKRTCRAHFENPPQGAAEKRMLRNLQLLGFL